MEYEQYLSEAPKTQSDALSLCRQLGYDNASFVNEFNNGRCPEMTFDGSRWRPLGSLSINEGPLIGGSRRFTCWNDLPEPRPRVAGAAKCSDLWVNFPVFGVEVPSIAVSRGLDLRAYAGGSLDWIGCPGNPLSGCGDFYCTDDGDFLEFGDQHPNPSFPIRALIDPNNQNGNSIPVEAAENYCGTLSNPSSGWVTAPTAARDVTLLCNTLGYETGQIVELGGDNAGFGNCLTVTGDGDSASNFWRVANDSGGQLVPKYPCSMASVQVLFG